ncbi:MAG: hypothetical protein MR531_04810 [Lachnospiraceae bacterium]|nr:hypothetical protein [Lachnospiraceae bacterium]
MAISGIGAITGMEQYRISSIHGNPYSMSPIQKIGDSSADNGKALVIATPEKKEDLYVKDYGELKDTRSTAIGDFAEILELQETSMTQSLEEEQSTDYAEYLNDAIGMMGFQNRLRDQLNGIGFVPFE